MASKRKVTITIDDDLAHELEAGGNLSAQLNEEGWVLLERRQRAERLAALLDELDDEVAGAGGRIYLAKDSRLRPEMPTRMYPRLDDFHELRARYDPRGVFTSDLARRLGL